MVMPFFRVAKTSLRQSMPEQKTTRIETRLMVGSLDNYVVPCCSCNSRVAPGPLFTLTDTSLSYRCVLALLVREIDVYTALWWLAHNSEATGG